MASLWVELGLGVWLGLELGLGIRSGLGIEDTVIRIRDRGYGYH